MPIVYVESDAFVLNSSMPQELGEANELVGAVASNLLGFMKIILGDPLPLILHVDEKKYLQVIRRGKR